MAQYQLKALNVLIGGRLFKKEEGIIFDDAKYPKSEIEAAFKAGFLVKINAEPVKEKPLTKKEKEAKIEALNHQLAAEKSKLGEIPEEDEEAILALNQAIEDLEKQIEALK